MSGGDEAAGYATVPVRHGVRTAARISALLYAVALATAAAAAWAAPVDTGPYLVLLLVAASTGCGAFIRLLAGNGPLSPAVALTAHEILVGERLVLAAAVVAAGVGPLPAVIAVLPALAFSLLTQARMRSRHEFPPVAALVARKDPA